MPARAQHSASLKRSAPASFKHLLGGDPSARDLLPEDIDGCPRARRKACEFTGLKETKGVHRDQLVDHPGAPRIVERPGELAVPLFEQPKDVKVALVVRAGGIPRDGFKLFQNAC